MRGLLFPNFADPSQSNAEKEVKSWGPGVVNYRERRSLLYCDWSVGGVFRRARAVRRLQQPNREAS